MPQSSGSRSQTTAGLCQHGGQLRLLRLSTRDSFTVASHGSQALHGGESSAGCSRRRHVGSDWNKRQPGCSDAAGLMLFVADAARVGRRRDGSAASFHRVPLEEFPHQIIGIDVARRRAEKPSG